MRLDCRVAGLSRCGCAFPLDRVIIQISVLRPWLSSSRSLMYFKLHVGAINSTLQSYHILEQRTTPLGLSLLNLRECALPA